MGAAPKLARNAMDAQESPRLLTIEPILSVSDVAAAVAYYRDVLEFENVWLWGAPPNHGGVSRDGLQIQFSLSEEPAALLPQTLWIRVEDLAGLYARHRELGADIVSPLEPKPWGVSEFVVRDLCGHHLRFAGHPRSAEHIRLLPEGVRIEVRAPTWDEMRPLIHAVGWDRYTNTDTARHAPESAVVGVVALSKGDAVGCALLTRDGAGFYYVRDVMVHPDWQRRGVGTALMTSLMREARQALPSRALVGLFTGDNLREFYARFGFRGPGAGLFGMSFTIP